MNKMPAILRLHDGKPIIERILPNSWENKVTFNPACVLLTEPAHRKLCVEALPVSTGEKERMLGYDALAVVVYRAQGAATASRDYTRSSLGLAVCTPDLEVLYRHPRPIMLPDQSFDNLGCEDPRITLIGDTFFMLYTAYATGVENNRIRIAVASSHDCVRWTKHGLIKADFNKIDNKNAMLFNRPVDGKLIMLHRPMEGENPMMVHWAEAGSVFSEWKTKGVLMEPVPNPVFADTWIGGGAPPIALEDGRFLMVYHIGNRAKNGVREYDLGLAIIDPSSPAPVVRRDEPFVRPTTPAETTGDADLGVNNVVFICGAYLHNDELIFPYAGADSVVLGGKVEKGALADYLK